MWPTRRLLCMMLLVAPLVAHAGERYQNHSGYGLGLDIPAGARACTDQPPSPDHGIRLLYGDASCDGDAASQRPSISFFVYYNTMDAEDGEPAMSARQLARGECAGLPVTRSKERLGRLALYECIDEDGPDFVTLRLIAQKTDKKVITSSNDYIVTVSCRKAELALYRRKLHALLSTASTAVL